MKLKVSELFYSIQGEGLYMGVPSIFLRTFGCNFKCRGFGMPPGELSEEAVKVADMHKLHKFTSYENLPLVSTGCDSYASWMPEFRDLSHTIGCDDLAKHMMELLPTHTWSGTHLVITGGEPLLGWQRVYPELFDHELLRMLRHVTFETNGTQPLHPDLVEFMDNTIIEWTFSVSPKLPNSGEAWNDAIIPGIVKHYQQHASNLYLKFVIATEQDANNALRAIDQYRNAGVHCPIYFMPVGGVESVYHLNNRQVVDLALKHQVRYSDRLQVPLFKNAWGT